MKKILLVMLSAAMILSITACSKKDNQSAATAPSKSAAYTVTDSRGKQITLTKTPEKIISLLPSDTEIVYALGDGDKLIAVDTYSDYPADAKKKKQLGSGQKTNIESIIGLKPDLVIMGTMSQTSDQYSQLENADIKVVVTSASDIANTYNVIEMLGKTLNKQTKAMQIVSSMKSGFEKIKNEVKGKSPVKVYVEVSPLKYNLWTCGSSTFEDEILTMLGAKNIFSDVKSWKQVSEEQVIARNPQVIITTVAQMQGSANPTAEIEGRKNWSGIDAVKNKKVFSIDSEEMERPGPRLVEAAQEVEKMIY